MTDHLHVLSRETQTPNGTCYFMGIFTSSVWKTVMLSIFTVSLLTNTSCSHSRRSAANCSPLRLRVHMCNSEFIFFKSQSGEELRSSTKGKLLLKLFFRYMEHDVCYWYIYTPVVHFEPEPAVFYSGDRKFWSLSPAQVRFHEPLILSHPRFIIWSWQPLLKRLIKLTERLTESAILLLFNCIGFFWI